MSAKKIAQFGLLTAMSAVLGYVDSLIPLPVGIPGVKLGLGNVVVLLGLYMLGGPSAAALAALKVLLNALMFAGLLTPATAYSLTGAALSLGLMLPLSHVRGLSVLGVSMAGAVGHNLGQLLMAMALLQTPGLVAYLPTLLAAAAVTGLLTGTAAKYAMAGLSRTDPALRARLGARGAIPSKEDAD